MPPAPLTADGPAVFVSVGENAVVGEGVSYVHMRNLKLVGPAPFDPAESDNEVKSQTPSACWGRSCTRGARVLSSATRRA